MVVTKQLWIYLRYHTSWKLILLQLLYLKTLIFYCSTSTKLYGKLIQMCMKRCTLQFQSTYLILFIIYGVFITVLPQLQTFDPISSYFVYDTLIFNILRSTFVFIRWAIHTRKHCGLFIVVWEMTNLLLEFYFMLLLYYM